MRWSANSVLRALIGTPDDGDHCDPHAIELLGLEPFEELSSFLKDADRVARSCRALFPTHTRGYAGVHLPQTPPGLVPAVFGGCATGARDRAAPVEETLVLCHPTRFTYLSTSDTYLLIYVCK